MSYCQIFIAKNVLLNARCELQSSCNKNRKINYDRNNLINKYQ